MVSLTTAINKLKACLPWEQVFVVVLLLLGAILRIRQYLSGRSLWADEAMLALNIVNRDFAGMFRPLDYDQGAPIGFLLVEKLFNSILGKSEFALRLFPLLVGLVSLWLFYLLLKRITTRVGLFVALALFVFNPRLVYYSSEVKQYIVDVAVTISLLLIALPLFNAKPQKRNFTWLALAGLIASWFSHPALFVLAGIGSALVIVYLQRRDFLGLRVILGIGTAWLINIGFLYLLILKDLNQNAYMREYWQGAFVPVPLWSDAGWFVKNIHENIGIQFGMPYGTLFIFALMLVGWLVLFLGQKEYALIFACILLATLIASTLQFYPFLERMILFLVPLGLVLLGKTADGIYRNLQKYPFLGGFAALLLAGYLAYGPVLTSYQSFIAPKYFEHIRPAMQYLHDAWKDGDALYVSQGAVPAFRYYAPFYGLEKISYTFGRREDYKNPQNLLSSLSPLRGQPRVWILFSHVYEKGDFNERGFILNYLNQFGEKKREFRVPGTSVFLYLYDLKD